MTLPENASRAIEQWRQRIDEIDRQLVALLNERLRCAMEIGRLKQAARLPLYQPEREQEILANVERVNPGPLPGTVLRRLFERILDEARSAERQAMRGEPSREA